MNQSGIFGWSALIFNQFLFLLSLFLLLLYKAKRKSSVVSTLLASVASSPVKESTQLSATQRKCIRHALLEKMAPRGF